MDSENKLPVVKGHFLLGSVKEVKRDFLGFMFDLFQQQGDVVKFFIGKKPVYLLARPGLIEKVMLRNKSVFVKPYDEDHPRGLALILGQGLVTSRGELWKKQRRTIAPVFQKTSLLNMVDTINGLTENWIDSLPSMAQEQTLDFSRQLTDLTLEIISRTMFGKSADIFEDRLPAALETTLKFAQRNFFHPLPMPLSIPTPANKAFKQAKAFLCDNIAKIITQRRSRATQAKDLLDILLAARDPQSGIGMSQEQIIDESITMYAAGHETTAAALTWTLYLIATKPAVQEKLFRELQQVLGEKTAGYDDLEKLPYTRAVLQESMRLYPPIVLLLRRVAENMLLDDIYFPRNAFTLVNLYNINHDPQLWQSAEQFDPDRFLDEARDVAGKKSFYPFGLGQRVCMGNHFAMMESQLILAALVRKFQFSYDGEKPPTPALAISLRPVGGMPLRFQLRQQNPPTSSASESKATELVH